jgi:hypothetical protein
LYFGVAKQVIVEKSREIFARVLALLERDFLARFFGRTFARFLALLERFLALLVDCSLGDITAECRGMPVLYL